eukprot:363169-Chlamydomonas_euryale.AAC.30
MARRKRHYTPSRCVRVPPCPPWHRALDGLHRPRALPDAVDARSRRRLQAIGSSNCVAAIGIRVG